MKTWVSELFHGRLLVAAALAIMGAIGWPPSPAALGEELAVAAASDLNFALTEIAEQFERQTRRHVRLSFGSSGNFFSQIGNGAPFDVYFSADIGYPKKLEEASLAVSGSLYRYAVGRIVVWVPNRSPLAVGKLGMEALLDPSIRRIAVANPKHAPYGRAAVEAMQHFEVYARVKDKLVFGENISQAAQFVESGASDIGIIALSLALAPVMKNMGKYWEIPPSAHAPLEQGVVILRASKEEAAARVFLEFLKGSQGQEIMRRYGFSLSD